MSADDDVCFDEIVRIGAIADEIEENATPEYYNNLSSEELREKIKDGSVYVIQSHLEPTQYGKVTISESRILLHSLESQQPEGTNIFISFKELLMKLNGTVKHPTKAFLQLGNDESVQGEVIISIERLCPRALNFMLLCSGTKGRSYKGKTLNRRSNTVGTVPSEEEEAVVRNITDGGVYIASVKKGHVYGCWCKHPTKLSRFSIWMEAPLVRITTKFGFVEEGMDVLERLFKDNQSYSIKNCGLVIYSAKIEETVTTAVAETHDQAT